MYARVTTITTKPDRIADMASQIPDLRPRLKSVPGLLSNNVVWRDDGQCVVMAIYESQAAAEAAQAEIQSIYAGMADLMAAPPHAEAYDNVANLLE